MRVWLACGRSNDPCATVAHNYVASRCNEKETGSTWYTINYSRKQKKHRVIVYPDGSIGE